MKIYTKTGDKGETSLLSGGRCTKDCISLQVVGALDELNAVLGVVLSQLSKPSQPLSNFIQNIQGDLFKVGATVVSLQSNEVVLDENTGLLIKDVKKLEKSIDKMSEDLPELKNFILPSGSEVGAFLHLARTVCRRAERELVGLCKQKNVGAQNLEPLQAYLNRLSDWLFVAARWVNWKMEIEEESV